MELGTLIGVLIVIGGGVMEGSFSLPLKYTPKWNWENTWGSGSLVALLLIPWPLAILTVPNLLEVYRTTSWNALVSVLAFGMGWGIGGIFFGLGVAALGLSLGLSLIMGLVAIGGSIIPLMMQHPEQLSQPAGIVLMEGVGLMISGLAICAVAGQMKESKARTDFTEVASRPRKVSFMLGLLFCVAAGLLSALVNFGLIFGGEVMAAAVRQGATAANSINAVWGLVFTSNYLVNIAYCAYLVYRHRSLSKFFARGTARYWVGSVFMGVMWAGGIALYGVGATVLGQFGAFLGFPVMLISSILTGNALGALTGEWTGVNRKPKFVMASGVSVLILAIVLLGYSNQLVG